MNAPTSTPHMPGAARRLLHRIASDDARRAAWKLIANKPGLADFYFRVDPSVRHRRVTRTTDLVMDGVGRSGNSYAYAAFLHANGPGLRLSHHLHSPRILELGVKYARPTILITRNPRNVLASLLQFDEGSDADGVLDYWTRFHERMLPILDGMVVADFPETTGDFGQVVRRCNEMFGTAFLPYERTEENERAVMEFLDQHTYLGLAAAGHGAEEFDRKVSRPTSTRRPADEIIAELSPPQCSRLIEAEALHAQIVAH